MKLVFILTFCMITSCLANTCTCPEACHKKEELGRSTWFLLHETVKHNEDTNDNAYYLGTLLESLANIYPCPQCRIHIGEYLRENNPRMTEQFMCDFHNDVNARLGKPLHLCDDATPASEDPDIYDVILDNVYQGRV